MSRISLTVTGMDCTGCESRVANALGRLDGVRHVEADHRTGAVCVDYDLAAVAPAALAQRLADAGFGTADRDDPTR